MTTKRDQALAQLAQQLQVPPRLLNLYPPAANHWTALLPVPPDGWMVAAFSGRRWGRTQAMEDWRARVWAEYEGGWGVPDDGPPAELSASCYKVPCPPWPRDLTEPDPCSIGDCLTCPGIGCGCECHWADWASE